MRKFWWKSLSVVLILYSIIGGFLLPVPKLPILHETIRNLYFHVPMWFSMMAILSVSVFYSIRYLGSSDRKHDIIASQAVHTGLFLGILGIVTGSLWAKFTWGVWWVADTKLNGAAVTILIYMAYTILRSAIDEEQKRARVAGVYNIFAYVMLIVFLMILPRMYDSLHPGNGGNPAFNTYDLDRNMRFIFYPAVIGWVLFGLWLMTMRVRLVVLTNVFIDIQHDE